VDEHDDLELLSKDELIEMLLARADAGVNLSFPGKAITRRMARRVRPRVQRTIAKYSVGSEVEQSSNVLVEGDNLHALVTLYRERGQMDLILTDPPYNTGNVEPDSLGGEEVKARVHVVHRFQSSLFSFVHARFVYRLSEVSVLVGAIPDQIEALTVAVLRYQIGEASVGAPALMKCVLRAHHREHASNHAVFGRRGPQPNPDRLTLLSNNGVVLRKACR